LALIFHDPSCLSRVQPPISLDVPLTGLSRRDVPFRSPPPLVDFLPTSVKISHLKNLDFPVFDFFCPFFLPNSGRQDLFPVFVRFGFRLCRLSVEFPLSPGCVAIIRIKSQIFNCFFPLFFSVIDHFFTSAEDVPRFCPLTLMSIFPRNSTLFRSSDLKKRRFPLASYEKSRSTSLPPSGDAHLATSGSLMLVVKPLRVAGPLPPVAGFYSNQDLNPLDPALSFFFPRFPNLPVQCFPSIRSKATIPFFLKDSFPWRRLGGHFLDRCSGNFAFRRHPAYGLAGPRHHSLGGDFFPLFTEFIEGLSATITHRFAHLF